MSTEAKTLMQMGGASTAPPAWDKAALVIVDLQKEYSPEDSGSIPLHKYKETVAEASKLLQKARETKTPIFHIQHLATSDSSPVFNPKGDKVAHMSQVKPEGDEPVIQKHYPSSFANTNLHELLQKAGKKEIILAGAMTSTCISSTAREAQSLGYRTTVVANACTTRDIPHPLQPGKVVPAQQVHEDVLTALSDLVAVIAPTADQVIKS